MVRELHKWLAADLSVRALRDLGWFDFLNGGAPDTDDARILAAAAVFALLIDDAGRQIHHDDGVVYAVLGFVESMRGGAPPTRVSAGLLAVLHASPVSRQSIEAWFLATYP
jgi:hypothetical protein